MTAASADVHDVGDLHDVRRVDRGEPALRPFNAAGILDAADVHVATTLGRLAGERDPAVLLAVALAVRGPRLGHVCVDLESLRDTVTGNEDATADLDALDWPDPPAWRAAVARSALVAGSPPTADHAAIPGGDPIADASAGNDRPLRLVGTRLYLDRYWRYERRIVSALHTRGRARGVAVDRDLLADGLRRLFPPDGDAAPAPDLQRLAAAVALLRPFAVLAGGPGTGKTTAVVRILALLDEQAVAAGRPQPRVALAAPTGKAARRMTESIAESVDSLDTAAATRERLLALQAATLHRLLRPLPNSTTRFRHHAANPLPHDVVVVDETSMVSVALLAKLLDAVRDDARLLLVGDPQQLVSVEAGAVLGDIVGATTGGLRMTAAARETVFQVTGQAVPASDAPAEAVVADGIVVLRRARRFAEDSGIAALAAAVARGDGAGAVAVLEQRRNDVTWIPWEPTDGTAALGEVRGAVVDAGAALVTAAVAGRGSDALEAVGRLRILCAHRRGPAGVAAWVPTVERWLAQSVNGFSPTTAWYVGRPVIVTRNDYAAGVVNGDVGVVVARPEGGVTVAFAGPSGVRTIAPTRLDAVETVHAMTVHKAQGSQFATAVVVLPDPTSRILTRELLYTGVTRAEHRLVVVGSAAAVGAAVERRVQRASGLGDALWGPGP